MALQQYQGPGAAGIEDIEDIERYRPGGFHPVHIGDVLGQKYKVLHKLGCGGFSTVWLARDLVDQQLYALKVLAADAPQDELDSILYLTGTAGTHSNVSSFHHHFMIVGPYGSHLCLVLSVLGPSVKQIRRFRLSAEIIQDAARQIANGLAHIHRAGVCHGDLTHANVLFGLRDVDRWTDSEVYQHFGLPNKAQLLFLDGSVPPLPAPRHIVEAINFGNIDPRLLSGNVCIVDFGLSFRTENPPLGIPGVPRSFLAPELCFGAPRSPSNDVWGLGCLVFELYTTRVLFPLVFDQLELLIGTIVDTLSQLPPHWNGHFVNQADRIFEPGQKDFWYDPSFKPGRLLERQIIEKCPQIPEHQRPVFQQLLASVLCLDPIRRAGAAEIAAHPWWFSNGGDNLKES